MKVEVIAKCTSCGNERAIALGEVEPGDMPFCEKCGSVMLAKSAKASRKE